MGRGTQHNAGVESNDGPNGSDKPFVGPLLFPIAVAVFAVTFYWDIADLHLRSRVYLQSVVVVLLFVLSLQLVAELRSLATRGHYRIGSITNFWDRWRFTASIILATVMLIVGMQHLGFYVMIVPFLSASMFLLGVRRLMPLVVLPFATLGIAYLVFSYIFGMPLP